MTNNDDLALKLEKAAEKATPGPWYVHDKPCEDGNYGIDTSDKEFLAEAVVWWGFSRQSIWREEDAKYIAVANPAAVLSLLAERKADKAENASLRQRVAELGRQLIAPLPIGELIQRLSDQTGEDWSEKYLEDRTVSVKPGEVLVTVSGFTGCGKSAIAGEIEIAMRAIGVPVTWSNGDAEKRTTGADWLTAIEMYKPAVRIVEINVPRAGIKLELGQ
ncbi:ead/Ea22-like family protein [Mangrovibacter plantisponsor]|uniref:Ead/Ea22-like protein n=1 Tax=Mangrovibacter plantisponsor TaxID=451513 RepID=A0A317PF93_9ENTR|nr:ead/Ea22-like family protein [Mangrovibacter plantisponsor]PWV98581.1 hypothetical protein DES37_1422 [Mangrovibacter plantisponsor]